MKKPSISNANIFLGGMAFFIVGIGLGNIWQLNNRLMFGVLFVSFFICLIFWRLNFNRRLIVLFFICNGFLLLGFFQTQNQLMAMKQVEKHFFQGKVVVENETVLTDNGRKIVGSLFDSQQKVLILAESYPDYQVGEVLNLACLFEVPQNFSPKFDYRRYLLSKGIFYVCRQPEITLEKKLNQLAKDEISSIGFKKYFRTKIFLATLKTKRFLEGEINRLYPMPESAFLSGLVLGGDDRLDEETKNNFQTVGMTHAVAVSGYNVAIIQTLIIWFLILLGFDRKKTFFPAILAVSFFVVLVGMPTSAVRAGVMGSFLLWAVYLGRLSDAFRGIILAAAVMLFFNPALLLADAGFQLSFLAALGLTLVYGPLSEKLRIENDFLEIKSVLLTTLCAQLGVVGILIYQFESFSLISFLANLLMLPLIPLITLAGFLSALLASVGLIFLGKILALVVFPLLKLEIFLVEKLANIPFASIQIESVGNLWFWGYYLFFLLLVFRIRRQFKMTTS